MPVVAIILMVTNIIIGMQRGKVFILLGVGAEGFMEGVRF